MELSVIIVSYNVRYFLEQCLHSVRKASENIACEVFVVDNNSADGSCLMVSSMFPEFSLITNHGNKGFSAANNQALKLASGRYLLLLNPDTIVEEDAFKKCMIFMDNHPDAGAVGVRMIDGRGKLLPESRRALPTPVTAFFKAFGFSYLFPKSRLFNRYYLGHLDPLQASSADVISGAFMFLRREAVIKTGLFDEDFFMYGEDIDYSYRLKKAGFSNYYCPEAKIIHFKGESSKRGKLNVQVHFYRSMRIFVKKHFAGHMPGVFVILIYLAIFLREGVSFIKYVMKIFLIPFKCVFLFFRHLASLIFPAATDNPFLRRRNTVIVSDEAGYARIKDLLSFSGSGNRITGRVCTGQDEVKEEVLGSLGQIREVIRLSRIKEVIFTTHDLSISQIIDSMHLISDLNIAMRITAPGGEYLLGGRHAVTFNRFYQPEL
jgi:GT2 family glycosyltransferase